MRILYVYVSIDTGRKMCKLRGRYESVRVCVRVVVHVVVLLARPIALLFICLECLKGLVGCGDVAGIYDNRDYDYGVFSKWLTCTTHRYKHKHVQVKVSVLYVYVSVYVHVSHGRAVQAAHI